MTIMRCFLQDIELNPKLNDSKQELQKFEIGGTKEDIDTTKTDATMAQVEKAAEDVTETLAETSDNNLNEKLNKETNADPEYSAPSK